MVFIIKGMSISVSNLTISLDGTQPSSLSLELSFDSCEAWARIALAHQAAALAAGAHRAQVWSDHTSSEDLKAEALMQEFSACMQAVVSSAICIDALYDHVVQYAPVSRDVRSAWKNKKTARYKQVCETIRSAFRLNGEQTAVTKSFLKILYGLRDSSVHPTSKPHPPMSHPDLGIASDWRLGSFRSDVADFMVATALGMIWDLAHLGRYRSPELGKFMEAFRVRLEELMPGGRPVPGLPSVTVFIPNRR